MKTIKLLTLICAICFLGGTLTSCEDETVQKWENTTVSYMLTISPDLLKFVIPEVTYIDSQGKIHKISGVQALDSLVNVNYAHAAGIDVFAIQTIKGTDYKCWTLNMNFKDRPFHSYFGVKYKKKDLIEDTTGKEYDFHHSIFSTTIYATSEFTTTYKINWLGQQSTDYSFGSGAIVENHIVFTKDGTCKGEDVEDYLNKLANTPDKAGFYITSDGKFTEKNDFPMD